MPATGDCAPERMLVAVRAMAPVAGSPPNMGETMLATPWPMSSTLGLWRSLLIWSEASADTSDSIAPRKATGKAGAGKAGDTAGAERGVFETGQAAGDSSHK